MESPVMTSAAFLSCQGGLPTLPESFFYRFFKRSFDLLAAVALGLLLLGPMTLIALAVRLDSPGPAIYTQQRLGLAGKPFQILKFRTMWLDAEADGPRWADKDDIRCTRVGRFLRRSRLDELPQLLNILRGEMSFVGPRPERPCFYRQFAEFIPNFHHRLAVKPGLTGLAQVSGGYDLRPEEKIVFDLDYMQNRSIRMDLSCLFKTFSILLTQEGAR